MESAHSLGGTRGEFPSHHYFDLVNVSNCWNAQSHVVHIKECYHQIPISTKFDHDIIFSVWKLEPIRGRRESG